MRGFKSLLQDITSLFREKTGTPTSAEGVSGLRYDGIAPWLTLPSPAMSISTVHRCVSVLAGSVASLPVNILRRRDGIFVADKGNPLGRLLNVEPDASVSAYDFWEGIMTDILLAGNAYVVPVYSPELGGYIRLVRCRRGTVTHDTDTDTYSVSDLTNGMHGTYGEADIIHIKGMSGPDPKTGVSVLTHARMSMQIASVSDRETYSRFQNGGDVRGIIGNDLTLRGYGEYQDKQLESLADKTDRLFRSGERIVSLPGQVSWMPLSMSSADMQFLESRKFTVLELCRFFGVHPSFVFEDTSSNYKSAEMANVAFLSNTLNPWLRKIENEFRRKLFAPGVAEFRKIEFDRSGLYACDLETKVRYQAQMIGAGLRTVNELRAEENRPPVDGGDSVFISANLKGIKELSATPATPPTTKQDNNIAK